MDCSSRLHLISRYLHSLNESIVIFLAGSGHISQEEADRLMAPQMPFRVEQVSPPPARSLAFLDRVGYGAKGRN